MKPILTIALLISSCFATAQKIYYKYNGIDGWIKVTESNWTTVDQKGDTTFYSQELEETNQDDPNERPKYEFNGAGRRILPPVVKKDTVQKVISVPFIVMKAGFKDTGTISYVSNTVYKDRYHTSKRPKVKRYKPKPSTPSITNVITYKKRLWMIVCNDGSVTTIESTNDKTAIARFKKLSSKPILAVTEFTQTDIIPYK